MVRTERTGTAPSRNKRASSCDWQYSHNVIANARSSSPACACVRAFMGVGDLTAGAINDAARSELGVGPPVVHQPKHFRLRNARTRDEG